jgi:predicted amidohydrolase
MQTLKVTTVTFETAWKNLDKDLKKFKTSVEEVINLFPDTQIILFPEITFIGYVLDESNNDVAQTMNEDIVSEIKKIARENKVAIIAGMIEKGESRKPYNTSIVINKDGEIICKYRKNHLFTESAEPEVYTKGESLTIFEFEGWKCGLAVCFDIRFPRLFEAYKKSGVECVFIGSRWIKGRNKPAILDFMVKARAHENQNFVVAVDAKGSDPNTTYHGISIISNPYGENIAKQNGNYFHAELDKKEIEVLSKALPLTDSFKESYEFI